MDPFTIVPSFVSFTIQVSTIHYSPSFERESTPELSSLCKTPYNMLVDKLLLMVGVSSCPSLLTECMVDG
jgi:hypothetical protein